MTKWYQELEPSENGYYIATNTLSRDAVKFQYEMNIYNACGQLVDSIHKYPVCYWREGYRHWYMYQGVNGIIHSMWDRESDFEIFYYIGYDEDE